MNFPPFYFAEQNIFPPFLYITKNIFSKETKRNETKKANI